MPGFIKVSETTTQTWGETALTDKGAVTARLVVPLDYVQDAARSRNRLPYCLSPLLKPEAVIGSLICVDNPQQATPIKAAHVSQECYSDKTVEPIAPAEALVLAGCRNARVDSFIYEPELRIDIDAK